MGRIRANTALYLAGKRILIGIIAAHLNTSIDNDPWGSIGILWRGEGTELVVCFL